MSCSYSDSHFRQVLVYSNHNRANYDLKKYRPNCQNSNISNDYKSGLSCV